MRQVRPAQQRKMAPDGPVSNCWTCLSRRKGRDGCGWTCATASVPLPRRRRLAQRFERLHLAPAPKPGRSAEAGLLPWPCPLQRVGLVLGPWLGAALGTALLLVFALLQLFHPGSLPFVHVDSADRRDPELLAL